MLSCDQFGLDGDGESIGPATRRAIESDVFGIDVGRSQHHFGLPAALSLLCGSAPITFILGIPVPRRPALAAAHEFDIESEYAVIGSHGCGKKGDAVAGGGH